MTDEFQEENEEITVDSEEEAGFLGQAEEKPDNPDEKKADEKQEEKDEPEDKKPDEKEDGGEPEETPDDGEKTAEQKALKRAEKYKDKVSDTEEKDEPEKKPDKEKKPEEKSTAAKITKEAVKSYLDILPDDDIPGEIIIGDETVNIKDLQENYPDDFNAIKVVSGLIAEKIVAKALDAGEFVRASDVDEKVSAFDEKMAMVDYRLQQFAFFDELRDIHPDAKKLAASTEFKEWVKTQPKHMQALGSTWDVEDNAAFLSAYKESIAKKNAKDHDNKNRNKKEEKDGLLGGGMRSKTVVTKKSGSGNDMDDEEAGFNEGLNSVKK
jgi:hypothetical protein